MCLVSIRGVSKRKGSTQALRDVSLDIAERESLVVLGPSGSGKTTLLRIIAGLEAPDAGTIRFGDELVTDGSRVLVPPERRDLSFVFQDLALWPHMTVRANVAFALRGARWPKPRRREALARALELCGLTSLADRRPHQLSGGQQQLVALSRALATEPPLVLMDEPLANLDAKLREGMRNRIAELRQRLGFACVYVTHDQTDAFALGDRVAILHDGQMEQIGRPEQVYKRPASRFVAEFVGKGAVLTGVVLDDGAIDTCIGRLPNAGAPPSGPVEVFVRPEQLALDAREGVAGAVLATRYAEGRWLVDVQIAGERVLAWCDQRIEPGTPTRVRLIAQPQLIPSPEGPRPHECE